MIWQSAQRTLRILSALLRQEILMITQYRWWLLAMQASAIVVPLISLLVWRGAIAQGAEPPITREYLTTYLVLVSVVTMLTSSWTATFLADSIRLGTLNSWLVRPCSTHLAALANNIAEKLAKLVTLTPLVILLGTPFHRDLELPTQPLRWLTFVWAVMMGAVMIFSLDIIVGSLGFWWNEVTGVDRLRQMLTLFFSGALIPVSLMPAPWSKFLTFQPFAYTVAFPIQALLTTDGSATMVGIAIQGGWVSLSLLIARMVWVRGLRRYSGSGA